MEKRPGDKIEIFRVEKANGASAVLASRFVIDRRPARAMSINARAFPLSTRAHSRGAIIALALAPAALPRWKERGERGRTLLRKNSFCAFIATHVRINRACVAVAWKMRYVDSSARTRACMRYKRRIAGVIDASPAPAGKGESYVRPSAATSQTRESYDARMLFYRRLILDRCECVAFYIYTSIL